MNTRMNVSLAFDDKYMKYAYITLLSLFMNNTDVEIYVYILQCDLTEESRNALDNLASEYGNHMVYLSISIERFKDMPTFDKWPVQVYFRLLLPELLPADVDRIFYFDSDLIISDKLSDLYNTDFEGNDIIACYDLNLIPANLDIFLYRRHNNLAPLFEDKTYINSGMLLINMNKFRGNYSLNSYLDAAKELEYKIFAPDQDLINYVHRGKIKHVDSKKYNYPAYTAFLDGIHSEHNTVPIMHFVCEKPWQGGNHAHFETELIWWKYAMQSPFKDFFTEKYISESISDPTIMQALNGNDSVKNELYMENTRLKKELDNALSQVKKVIAMFSNQ